jgi:hypothetical protein
MIHLSVNLANLTRHSGSSSAVSKALTLSSASFGDQLSEALTDTLSKFGIDPTSIKLTVENVASQNNVARQNSVPQKPAVVAMADALGFKGLVPHTPVTSTTPATPASATQKHWYAEDAADDAYWSKQPDAVQKLREIEDPDQRAQIAGQLTAQGYLIDVPVMVWGWDAAKTTQLRQSFGYTWVPSAESQQVSSAPGLTAPGATAYDPAHPPARSMAV